MLAEVALALVLLVGAALLIRSFDRLQRVEPGFQPEGVLTVRLSLPRTKYPDEAHLVGFYGQLTERVMAAPGVSMAAISSSVPMGAGASTNSFSIEGRPLTDPDLVQDAETFAVSPGYFTTLGIPLKAGRLLESGDGASAPGVAVVSEAMARRFWPGREPLGARVSLDGGRQWFTVVGMVGDVRNEALAKEPCPQLYLPFAQLPMRAMYLAVRAAGARPTPWWARCAARWPRSTPSCRWPTSAPWTSACRVRWSSRA